MIRLCLLIVTAAFLYGCGGSSSNPVDDAVDSSIDSAFNLDELSDLDEDLAEAIGETLLFNSVDGSIALSGDDTGTIGTELSSGYAEASSANNGQEQATIVHPAMVSGDDGSGVILDEPEGSEYGYLLQVSEPTDEQTGSVALSILVDEQQFNYLCTVPVTEETDCGADSIQVDVDNNSVTLNEATLVNTETGVFLTMDGTMSW